MRVKAKLKGHEEIALLEHDKENQSSKDGKYKYVLALHQRRFSSLLPWKLFNKRFTKILFIVLVDENIMFR